MLRSTIDAVICRIAYSLSTVFVVNFAGKFDGERSSVEALLHYTAHLARQCGDTKPRMSLLQQNRQDTWRPLSEEIDRIMQPTSHDADLRTLLHTSLSDKDRKLDCLSIVVPGDSRQFTKFRALCIGANDQYFIDVKSVFRVWKQEVDQSRAVHLNFAEATTKLRALGKTDDGPFALSVARLRDEAFVRNRVDEYLAILRIRMYREFVKLP